MYSLNAPTRLRVAGKMFNDARNEILDLGLCFKYLKIMWLENVPYRIHLKPIPNPGKPDL